LPLFGGLNFQHQKVRQLKYAKRNTQNRAPQIYENFVIYNMRTSLDQCMLNIDMETILDRTRDILDYTMVYEHFGKKWSGKYKDHSRIQITNDDNND
jgi:hypothetical protein